MKHKLFSREGANVLADVEVPLHIAILGGMVRVPTIDGDVDLTLKAGVQPNDLKKLSGRGFPNVGRSSRGDQLVKLKVTIPKKVTNEQKELLIKAFGNHEDSNQDQSGGGMFGNLFK
jgi:molecular chaperone DnaJ